MNRIFIYLFVLILAIAMVIPTGVSVQADSPVTIHLGSGSITSTSLDTYGTTWGPANDLWFNLSAGLKVTIVGLNMGQVPYTGAWGWPPVDGEDGGNAQLWLQDGYGGWSRHDLTSAANAGGTWDAQGTHVGHDQGFRKYLVQNFRWSPPDWASLGNSQYNVEPWKGPRLAPGPNSDGNMGTPNTASDKFDLEYKYVPGVGNYTVSGRHRMYYAASWDEMSLPKPPWPPYKWQWNKAINNTATPDTAWLPFYENPWTVPVFSGPANLRVAFQNRGVLQSGYWTISWDDIVVEGTPVPAAEVWVDDNWVGTIPGTEVEPGKYFGYNAFATIQSGVNGVASNGTVHVYYGTYSESVTLNKTVCVISNPGAILQGPGTGNGFLIKAPNVTINGFEIKNYAIGIRTYGGPSDFGDLDILNCNIHNNTQNGILIVYDTFSDVTIQDTSIQNNNQNGIGIANAATIVNLNIFNSTSSNNGQHGLFLANAKINNLYAKNSSFSGSTSNGFCGITVGTTASNIGSFTMEGGSLSNNKGGGLYVVQTPSTFGSLTLDGVIIQDNGESGIMLGGGSSTGSLTITNSTFQRNGWEDIDLSGGWFGAFSVTGDTAITNNCFRGGAWAAVYVGGAGSFTGDVDINLNCFTTQACRIGNENSKRINATNNWWGNEAGPKANQNYGEVNYDPWLATLTYTGKTLFANNENILLKATLTNSDLSLALEGGNVVFSINGSEVGNDMTDASGLAQIDIGKKEAGVYEVTSVATYPLNGCQFNITTNGYFAVYNPNEGFVTGGGWIYSEPGAYIPYPDLEGKANFAFVSKYMKGANVPTGNTEFQFKAGNLNFKSTSYEKLIVAGAKAQYWGIGTLNGASGYAFMLTVIDGQLNGGGGVDKFRIKIKDSTGVVYDNRLGDSDDLASSDPQEISGGSIVIHK